MRTSKIFKDIEDLLKAARSKSYYAVNSVMVETYWKIGQRIVEEEQSGKIRAEYGSKLIENLSKYLTDIFGKGFSEANLLNMRNFYIAYPKFPRHRLGNLSWSNITKIIRLDNIEERNYYLKEAAEQNWSYRQLERNIKTGYYQRLLSSQNKETNLVSHQTSNIINTKELLRFVYDYALGSNRINNQDVGKP